jgi:D-3-phosphoglycerate dehydrogenase
MRKFILVITSPAFCRFSPELITELNNYFEIINVRELPVDVDDEKIIRALDGSDAIVLGMHRISRRVMESVSTLKIIARYGLGYENIDVKAATELGIVVTYCRFTDEEVSVAEHTFALILAAAKKVVEANEYVKSGGWRDMIERIKFVGYELSGKTLGIIGLGHVGRRVAEIARRGFNMRVIAYDPYIPDEVFKEYGVKRVSDLDELIKQSDIITVHAVLTEETYNLLNAERLQKVKEGVIIVNTARGGIINEKALVKLLKEGKIYYAALDVLTKEPPTSDSELLRLPNVIITPHIAAFTYEALRRMDRGLVDDIIKFLVRKERPLRIVNPEVFDSPRLRFKEFFTR